MRVFITGASSGLGAELARHYARLSCRLGLVARERDRLAEFAATLPHPCSIYALDVADGDALGRAAADFIATVGVPDIVIANAGISIGTVTEHACDLPVVKRIFDTNVLGVANTFQPFIAGMRQARRGTLAAIASVAGIRGMPGAGAYCASKAAVGVYLESLRVELRDSGIRVSCIAPGYIATRMTEHNPYRMPFILSAPAAARRIARKIEAGVSFAIVPWQMAIAGRGLRLVPDALFDRVFARVKRKPRAH